MDNIDDLISKFKKGDETIFKKIVEQNTKLLTIIAKKYKRFFSSLDLDELVVEGTYGLFQAVKQYDTKKKVQFSTYAQHWIKKYVRDYVIKSYTMIKIPYIVLKNLKKILCLIDTDKHISAEEISKKLKLNREQIDDILFGAAKTDKTTSLDTYLDKEDEQETVYDIVPDVSEPTVEDITRLAEKKRYIETLLVKLSHQEAEIIKWRFGIVDQQHHTLKDMAKKMNLSTAKIKEIEEIAVAKLKLLTKEVESME